ncbi:uncharacterized protein TRIADDRAFT_23488, partial [Trichoplax adhaerens]
SFELSEDILIRDLIYTFQGINGKVIKLDQSVDAFRVDFNVGVPKHSRELVHKLAEIGWLYRKIRKFIDQHSTDQAYGLVGQSFCTALQDELTEFYRLIAVLDAQVFRVSEQQLSVGPTNANYLSLHRLSVWTYEPLQRLTILASLTDICTGKKGGALASTVHSYYQHGNPSIRNLIKDVLGKVVKPLNFMLHKWIYDGQLADIHHEFFISSESTVQENRLWRNKYGITKSMLPSFIAIALAKKILLIGKSINFIRQVCMDRSAIFGIKPTTAVATNGDEIFTQKIIGSQLEVIVDSVYTATSKHLLKILNEKYKFMDHLKALRRYLLLGQGDFVIHLMDSLAPDLNKPASNLYVHNLTGVLETAIRATNAQYDDADIIKRLDIRLLEVSPGDTGWDIFSLDYHVDGPISTVFTAQCMINYLRMFNFLWRLKRMEFVLGETWRNQLKCFNIYKHLPGILPLLHASNILTAELIHFINQMQYYIMFEVLECAWDELVKRVEEAKDLDDVIDAHDKFQEIIITRSLLDSHSRDLQTQIRSIFNFILQFQNLLESLFSAAQYEVDSEKKIERDAEKRSKQGQWGMTDTETEIEERRVEEFISTTIPTTLKKLNKILESSKAAIRTFLLSLISKADVSLRFLCFRLDFNEFYREQEPRLKSPLRLQRKKRIQYES